MVQNTEIKLLRQLQNCLGDMHDGENVLKALRKERRDRETVCNLCEKLKAQKCRQLHAFKKHRKALTRLWYGAA
jgi:CHAD domain-containing protein